MAKYCMKCGGQCADQAMQCPRCGAMLGMQNSGHVSQRPSGGGSQFSGGSFSPQNPSGGPGLAIASMVLGIVSLILTCILPYVSWVLAIVGIVLAAIAKKKAKSGMATAGLVCSIIALAVWVVVIILLVVVGVSVGLAG